MLLKLSNPTAFTLGKIIDIVDRAREQEHVNSKTRSSYVFLGPGYKFYAPLATFVTIQHKKRKLLRKVFANHEDLRTTERQHLSRKI